MAPNTLLAPAGGFRLAPMEPRHAPLFCFALLTVSCALASFALACATRFAIGAGAFAATAASVAALRTLPQNRTPLVLAVTLVCAYGAYEFALFAVTPFLGGAGAFTAAIIARLGFLNAMWLAGLVAACESVRLLKLFRRGRAIST
jgi:hypothetical protein